MDKIAAFKDHILERVAQTKWRAIVDKASNPSELRSAMGKLTRNINIVGEDSESLKGLYLGGADIDMRHIPESIFKAKELKNGIKDDAKRFISKAQNMPDNLASNKPMKERRLGELWDIVDRAEERKIKGVGPVDNSDEYMPIIHGGEKNKIEAFLQHGNSHYPTPQKMNVNGKDTNRGIMAHSITQFRAPQYAERSAERNGGEAAILTGKIQKKYLYPAGKFDEYVVPREHYDKIEDAIVKEAKLNDDVQLYPHQQRAINREGDGVIYAHSVGSGKTLTAIARFEKLKAEGKANKALVVVPAGLRSNFHDQGVLKFTDSKSNIIGNGTEINKGLHSGVDTNADYNIISYEMFRKDPERYIAESGADTLITDESHRGKNEGTATTNALKKYRSHFKNYIGLTGSVISNSVADVQPLVDVAAGGDHILGKSKADFEKRYISRSKDKVYSGLPEKRIPIDGFRHKRDLKKELSKYVDYTDYDDVKELAKMPNKRIHMDNVPITKEQAELYKRIIKDNPEMKKLITMKRLETLKDEDAAKAFAKMIESRKLMNSVGSVVPGVSLKDSVNRTPKTRKLIDDVENHLKTTPDGQAILLTHLVNGGTDVLEEGLKQRHIPYGKFIGKGNKGVTEETRNKDVDDYNKRKKRVMIISSAGGEGLSLNDTTWEGVLDPHYNPEKMNQMEARGIRSGGLSHRPKQMRNVDVHRYMATMPKTFGVFKSPYKTPDEVIYEIAHNKDQQNQHLFNLLKENNRKYEREHRQKY